MDASPTAERRRRTRRRPAGSLLLAALLAAAAWGPAWSSLAAPRRASGASPAPGSAARRPRAIGGSALPQPRVSLAPAGAAKKSAAKKKAGPAFIPTDKAPFLNVADQPLLLSPDGLRTARFEYLEEGLVLKVEASPAFGDQASVKAVATSRDVVDRVRIIPSDKLGIRGVRDLFWLDDRCFLITGFEGQTGKFYGWVADLGKSSASVISVPTRESSLFVPTGADNLPLLRRDEQGRPEVLLGFNSPDEEGNLVREWSWYSTATGDLVDATEDESLPTSLWREVLLSDTGLIDAVLLVNGTVHRRTPEGWRDLGQLALPAATEDPNTLFIGRTVMPREYLLSTGPDFSVYAIDKLSASSSPPAAHPPVEDITMDEAQGGEVRDLLLGGKGDGGGGGGKPSAAAWVLEQSRKRQTAALVHVTADGAPPRTVFAHPFADATALGVWIAPGAESPGAIMVEDLRPQTYALNEAQGKTLASLREALPPSVRLGDVEIPTQDMEPALIERHGDRWLVSYWHPTLAEPVIIPSLVEEGTVSWIGDKALPVRGGALSAAAVPLKPRVEGFRVRSGEHDVPVYLVLPASDPGALIVRVHEGPDQRDGWGADGLDAWLLSRGYGVLKVNYRGSRGFGSAWSDDLPASPEGGGFLDDVAAAVRWALDEREVVRGVDGGKPPVAIMGSYFGGYAVLQAMLRQTDLFACGVAVAPIQQMRSWPDSFIADGEVRKEVRSSGDEALSPLARSGDLRALPLMVVEYERDQPTSRDLLLESLSPAGIGPDDWPAELRFVQYAGEGTGGGVVRQNSLDQYRRIDGFLHGHLSPLAAEGRLLREPFYDELPFLSAALLPRTAGGQSNYAKSVEVGFEEGLREKDAAAAESLPDVRESAAGAGFSKEAAKTGKRKALLSPAWRMSVRSDGVTEITMDFDEPPVGLHVMLSDVWLHVRAEGVGFTLALPRRPDSWRSDSVEVSKLPGERSFLLEVKGDPQVGAIENYQRWAGGGGGATVARVLAPKDIEAAPVIIPASL